MKYTTGLFIYRIILSFLVIKNVIFYLPMADELFGLNAILPMNIYVALVDTYLLKNISFPFYYPFAPQIFLIITFISATFFLFGTYRFISGILLFYCILMMKLRNGFILDGSDNVIQVTLPLLILAECLQEKFIIKNKIFSRLREYLNGDIFLIALKIQVCFVYFFTSLAKLQGEVWLNGTATYYTMRVAEFNVTSWNVPLTENHYFVVLSTYFTILFEIAFPFLIWFRQTKFWVIWAGILLHLGIWVFMRIDNFSWIMIGTYFVFVNDLEYSAITSYFTKKRLSVYYDSWCPKCVRFVTLIQKIDIFENINYESIRGLINENIDSKRALLEMPSIEIDSNEAVYGFNSLVNISKSLIILWFLYPVFFILKISKLGDILYREIANNRKIFHCDELECKIP